MKKKLKFIIPAIIVLIIIIAVIIVVSITKSAEKKPFNTANKSVNFEISSGENFNGVLTNLSNEGVLKDGTLLKLDAKLTGKNPNITPGDYSINSAVSFSQLINILNSQKTIRVVIPEGYTVDQIASTLSKFGLCTEQQFISAVETYPLPAFIKPVKGRRYELEGYLFPTTYEFTKGESPNAMIQNMLNMFVLSLDQSIANTGVKIKPSQINEVITKASIIEGEAKTEKTMALVSSVIDNRIKANMPLQMDATIIYAMGKHVNKVYDKDLKIDSPYNTYTNKGLPIGPICNPGEKAIDAALKPAQSDYTYYILTSNTDFFTNNYQDFLKEKAKLNTDSKETKTNNTTKS